MIAVIASMTVLGFVLRRRDGRVVPVLRADRVEPAVLGLDAFGDRATLVQFSTPLCARCPGVHRKLSTIAREFTGVSHVDIDLTDRNDLASRFAIMQTPTTLIISRDGFIQARIAGTPADAEVRDRLALVEENHNDPSPRH